MRGYRVGEVPLPPLPPVKSSLKFKEHKHGRRTDPLSRPVVSTSLGCQVEQVCLPHACPNDPHSMKCGVMKRFGCLTPKPDVKLLDEFSEFCISFITRTWDPLPGDTVISVPDWLDKTDYPLKRKIVLQNKWDKVEVKEEILRDKKYTECSSFMKDEFYLTYKYPRAINSRSDEFKCLMGPYFKAIEKVVFDLPHFIKKIPVADRPQFIKDRMLRLGYTFVATDYTAYEAHFVPELMRKCEFILYKYMAQNLSGCELFFEGLEKVLAGNNVCNFKDFKAEVLGVRMSGEMCTSLGNGFSNLMFMLFLASKFGEDPDDVNCVVEGDDGLKPEQFEGPAASDFAKLGLDIKLERHVDVCEASFCGLIFDVDDLINVADPMKVLATTGWAAARYAQSRDSKLKTLLRCKALSIAHQYPGCPVISSFSQYLLRVTRSYDVRHMIENWRNTYERQKLLLALRDEKLIKVVRPPCNTRFLVEKKFSIPVERQLRLEKYFDECQVLQPIPYALVNDLVPSVWAEYYENYNDTTNNVMYSDKSWNTPYL